jgi:hypothetical protein
MRALREQADSGSSPPVQPSRATALCKRLRADFCGTRLSYSSQIPKQTSRQHENPLSIITMMQKICLHVRLLKSVCLTHNSSFI